MGPWSPLVPGPYRSLVPPHVSWALGCKGSLPDSPSLHLGAWRLIPLPQISWAAWTCSTCLCSGALNTPVHVASKFGLRQQVDAHAQRGSSGWHGTCWHATLWTPLAKKAAACARCPRPPTALCCRAEDTFLVPSQCPRPPSSPSPAPGCPQPGRP